LPASVKVRRRRVVAAGRRPGRSGMV